MLGVFNGLEGSCVCGNRHTQLAKFDCRHAMIMVDDTQLEIPHLAAERVAKNDQLNDRKDERHDDQRRTAPKPSELTLKDGHGSMHKRKISDCGFRIADLLKSAL